MKKLFIILVMLVAMNASGQWVVQTSGVTSNLYDVEFLNRYTGWACGIGGKILKTTNGGINWMNIPNPSNIGGGRLRSIAPVDSMFCYVSGGYDVILKTTNGGANWIEISNGPLLTGGYNGISFINRDTGWFCGSYRLLRTTNGGLSFDSVQAPSYCSDMYFRNFNEGLYCTEGSVYKTTNSGMNWFNTNVPTNGYAYQFKNLSVFNNQYVSLVGGAGPFYRSTDFGTTWQCLDSIHSYPPAVLNCCSFSSVNIGYAGGNRGYLYKTTNGGNNWYRQRVETGSNLMEWLSIYCFNDTIVWGVGGVGFITHTTTGGEWLVGIQNISTETPSKYSLSQNYPNPFNPITNVKFSIVNSGNVKLVVYNIQGREVQTLVNESLKPGTYEAAFDGSALNSGVYFYKLVTGGFTETKKMILIK